MLQNPTKRRLVQDKPSFLMKKENRAHHCPMRNKELMEEGDVDFIQVKPPKVGTLSPQFAA